ncbi:MAG: hypothetical protein BVN35_08120 [Proteobacteria bacterium ST_bin11]|nr:MAG: hypothetical protein BVN35_08120 [Proteobacteria bacterium ST_bin11]
MTIGEDFKSSNTLLFTIRNLSNEAPSATQCNPIIYLRGTIGANSDNLFLTPQDAQNAIVDIVTKFNDVDCQWRVSSDSAFCLAVEIKKPSFFSNKDETIQVRVTNIVTNAVTGDIRISLSNNLDSNAIDFGIVKEPVALKANLYATLSVTPSEDFRDSDFSDSKNRLVLMVKNLAATPIASSDRVIKLSGNIGNDRTALFLTTDDARSIAPILPEDWRYEWDFSIQNKFCLLLKTSRDCLFAGNESLTITLPNLISRTPCGDAQLDVSFGFSKRLFGFLAKKIADTPGIISFESEPRESVSHLRGDNVVLKWQTYGLQDIELTRSGSSRTLAYQRDGELGGRYTIVNVTADSTYRLRGYDGDRVVERELTVKVLRPGWYDAINVLQEGDPGYPVAQNAAEAQTLENARKQLLELTLLINANNEKIYGIFRCFVDKRECAMLFETENPFADWSLVESSVAGKPSGLRIPSGFSTSPGVYADNKIWLIGGSQIDKVYSNEIWCFDPKQKIWSTLGQANFPARMGHGVVELDNKIWVMGGHNGKALFKDIWTFDPKNEQWTLLTASGTDDWKGACLISPTIYQKHIWLYGGASKPGAASYNDLYVFPYSNNNAYSSEKKNTDAITDAGSKTPIGSCLQFINNDLLLFGKFRTEAGESRLDEALAFRLSNPETSTWERFPSDGLESWGADTTFSYQAINFRDKMLVAKALPRKDEDKRNPVLKIYVS